MTCKPPDGEICCVIIHIPRSELNPNLKREIHYNFITAWEQNWLGICQPLKDL